MCVGLGGGGIQMGRNGFIHHIGGGVRVRLSGIDLVFSPRCFQGALELDTTQAHPEKGEIHQWILPGGLCDVNGTIEIGETKLAFAGTGMRDQQYGTAPLLHGCFGGHLILKDKALIFRATDRIHVVTAEATSLKIGSEAAPRSHQVHSMWGLSCPRELKLTDKVLLWNPKIVDSKVLRAEVVYEADWQGERAVAMCEIDAGPRLGWPIVGSLMELGTGRAR